VSSIDLSNDTITNVNETVCIMEAFGINARDVFPDDIRVDRGVTHRLKERGT